MAESQWHSLSGADVAETLDTDAHGGLGEREAQRRLQRVGRNTIEVERKIQPWRLFVSQFSDFMVLVLLGATVVSALLGETLDAITILIIVVINGVLGFIQEYRAERCLEALRELSAPVGRVIRGGQRLTVPADQLVPGDLVLLATGDRVPADLRLTESVALEVDEAALTGESTPVAKTTDSLGPGELPLADRRNLIFLGTLVTRGHGQGLVVATGASTQMGRIAHLIARADDQATPLQRRLEELGRLLVYGCLGICVGVFALGVAQGRPVRGMFLTAVSLAVAAIPEGLPAIVTVALALGVQRMSRRGAIIRRLPAVETLGCTTAICADKTGTLTRNEMTLREIWAGGRIYEAEGLGYAPEGGFKEQGKPVSPGSIRLLRQALEVGLLCNTATLVPPVRKRRGGAGWRVEGDPTEGALLVAAAKGGLSRPDYERRLRLAGEIPFSAERRRMTMAWDHPSGVRYLYLKGALDVVLGRCKSVAMAEGDVPLTAVRKAELGAIGERMAGQGLRVLGLAVRQEHAEALRPDGAADERWETDLVLAGIVGLHDPPRPEAAQAIGTARRAGVRTLMITGDHALTAASVAAELGLTRRGDPVVTGSELERMSDAALQRTVGRISVYARVSPEHKLRLVKALQANDEIVAMTGDGVNDAPAISQAAIGISMGLTGTDVAKEASAMVLSDDNYATIVGAVEEGRRIYENIRKFIRYLLTGNVGEVLAMTLAVALNLPLPLIAIQILWMNLVTDGLPALALGVDHVGSDVMSSPPRRAGEGIFSGGMLLRILVTGTLIGVTTVGVFLFGLTAGYPVIRARTIAFTTLVLAQLLYVFRCRENPKGFELQLGGNPALLAATGLSLAMQLAVIYLPALAHVFGTVPLAAPDWFIVLVAAGYASMIGDIRPRRALRRAAAGTSG